MTANMQKIIEEDVSRICNAVDFRELSGKKVLVTGASGMLGIYLLATLKLLNKILESPAEVIAIVHSNPNEFFRQMFDIPKFTIARGSLDDFTFVNSLPKADFVIHAAGYGQPKKFTAEPIKTLELNILGTLVLLKNLAPNGKFLFTSSAEVYTGLTNPPFSESDIGTTNTTHPRSSYIEGKRSGEAICQAYRQKGVNAKSARIALTFGPGTKQGDSRALNTIIENGIKGNIQLLDQGTAVRTFLYVADAVEMLWNILLHGSEPIYNVAGNYEVSIYELALKVAQRLNKKVYKANNNDGLPGAPLIVRLNTNLYEKEFKTPQVHDFDSALDRTIAWQLDLYRKN